MALINAGCKSMYYHYRWKSVGDFSTMSEVIYYYFFFFDSELDLLFKMSSVFKVFKNHIKLFISLPGKYRYIVYIYIMMF